MLKAFFSIATTPKCKGGATLFAGLFHVTLDHYLKMLSVKQDDIKCHFTVFGITPPGIELQSPGPFANTLLIRPMTRVKNKVIVYVF